MKIAKITIILILAACIATPIAVLAAAKKTPFYYAGWMPFWRKQAGAFDVALNLKKIHEVSPFSYEIGAGGKIIDKLKMTEEPWPGWLAAARDLKVKIIPTIAWFDGKGIHKLLSNKKTRIAHENAIIKLVKDMKFDGIDIDYEAKLAETNPYFSLFIQGLAIRLHPLGKTLACTVEARMPVSSRYSQTGTADDHKYANDYRALNKYCDEVRLMTYDQGVIDVKLNAEKGDGQFYAPVSDPDWAKKIVQEALKYLSPKKIMLGIPTYGYEYEVAWVNGQLTYKRLRSHTFFQAMDRSESVGVAPERNSAGELNFSYATTTPVDGVSPSLSWLVDSEIQPAAIAAIVANPAQSVTRYVTFSDAESAAQKIALAKKMGLRGVVFFKLDGDQDPLLWDVMK